MLPQIVGPGTFTPSPLASSVAERSAQGAQPAVGETAAAATRPEVANRVDPPRVIPAPLPLPEERRRDEPTPPPPDPEAPAGPPPAFDATPLQRAREAALAPTDLIARPAPQATEPEPPEAAAPGTPPAREADGPEEAARPARADAPRRSEPDEALRERMETEVAEVRRMAEPEPDRALDLTR
jgi:hypothetical protein